jgi:hypothetical protein
VQTVYDWASVAVFIGLVILFLQRSVGEAEPRDKLWHYLPPAVGCAFANYAGNQGIPIVFWATMAAVVVYIFHILKPFQRS